MKMQPNKNKNLQSFIQIYTEIHSQFLDVKYIWEDIKTTPSQSFSNCGQRYLSLAKSQARFVYIAIKYAVIDKNVRALSLSYIKTLALDIIKKAYNYPLELVTSAKIFLYEQTHKN